MDALDNGMGSSGDFVKTPLHVVYRYVAYFFATVGVIGNLFVILVTLKHTTLWRQLTCKYIVNQSVIDAITLALLLIRVHMIPGDRKQLASMGELTADVYCRLWVTPFLLYGLLLSSIYNLVAISVERYLGIVRPLWHKVSFTHNRVTLSIVGIWLLSVSYMACVVAVPSSMAGGECQPARNWPSQGVQTFVGSITLCVSLVVPLCIHAFWYGSFTYTNSN